ncbi:MAG TPA: exodeoxyribonuclease VII large subunit, partial [Nitrospiria bacterium]|nr:exodeoxyribonuclease VII large subunit [Nitrospiria bacterium]
GDFGDVWVEGEISNLRNPGSGHYYLTLKDAQSQLRAVVFRSVSRVVKFALKDGLAVICRGHVTVYEPRGEYQLVVDYVEPKGAGALQLAFEQLKERLARDGLFDAARKRALPFLPTRLGVITSPSGAVIRDILHVLKRRFPTIPVLLLPVPVQGPGAAGRIADAIDEANALSERLRPDVLIVARGGGSLEDLWAFNEEIVARAIAASAIPVVSAVGHETDYTIADFVADLRAPTPSAAAELVVPRRDYLMATVATASERLAEAARSALDDRRARVSAELRALRTPERLIESALLRVDDLSARLRESIARVLAGRREQRRFLSRAVLAAHPSRRIETSRLAHQRAAERLAERIRMIVSDAKARVAGLAARTDALSPLAILGRGYSLTRLLPSRRIVRTAADVVPGDRLLITLGSGEVTAEAREIRDDAEMSGS